MVSSVVRTYLVRRVHMDRLQAVAHERRVRQCEARQSSHACAEHRPDWKQVKQHTISAELFLQPPVSGD